MSILNKDIYFFFNKSNVIIIFSFIGGYVDTIGYINLDGLFTSSVTGNVVIACIVLSDGFESYPHGTLTRFLVTSFFVIGGILINLLPMKLRYYQYNESIISIFLILVEIIFLLFALIIGVVLDSYGYGFSNIKSLQVIIIALILSTSMGVQQGIANILIENCPPTIVVTTALVGISKSLSDIIQYYLASKHLSTIYQDHIPNQSVLIEENFQLSINKLIESIQPLIAFICGGIFGSFVTYYINFACLFIPIFLLLLLIIDILYNFQLNNKSRYSNTSQEIQV